MHPRFLVSAIKICVILFISLMFTCAGQNAFAQNSITQAVELTKSALEDYDFIELESADTKISQAVKLVENAGINDPGAANIYIAEGVISYGRFKDSDPTVANERAFAAFLKASVLNPNVIIPNDYKTDELNKILENAKQMVAASQKASQQESQTEQNTEKQDTEKKDETPQKVAVEIQHPPVTSTDRCNPLVISATIPENPEVSVIRLNFANDNQMSYTTIDMLPNVFEKGVYNATIPAEIIKGDHLKYYIEVQNDKSEIVATVGTFATPMQALLMGECNTEETTETTNKDYGTPIFQLSTMIGTGFGFVEGDTLRCKGTTKCNGSFGEREYAGAEAGMSTLPFHIRIDAAVNLPAHFQMSLYLRIQAVNYASEDTLANILFGLSVRYFILHEQPYRLYVGLGIGYGGANATVFLGEKFGNFKDIYKYDGPIHIAPELGFLWTLVKNVGLAFDMSIPIYFPNKPSFHIDLSVGPFFQF